MLAPKHRCFAQPGIRGPAAWEALLSLGSSRQRLVRAAVVMIPETCAAQYQEQATYRDPESLEDIPLVPGMSKTDNMLRWGFIKKACLQTTS